MPHNIRIFCGGSSAFALLSYRLYFFAYQPYQFHIYLPNLVLIGGVEYCPVVALLVGFVHHFQPIDEHMKPVSVPSSLQPAFEIIRLLLQLYLYIKAVVHNYCESKVGIFARVWGLGITISAGMVLCVVVRKRDACMG